MATEGHQVTTQDYDVLLSPLKDNEETGPYGTCASWHGPLGCCPQSGRYATSVRLDRGTCRRTPWAMGGRASCGPDVGGQRPDADPIVADGFTGAAQRLCAAVHRHR